MGRILMGSVRTRLQDKMRELMSRYSAALKDDGMQEAFDDLWAKWGSEMGAMIYLADPSVMDMLLLTAVVDTRRIIMELEKRMENTQRE